MSDFPSQEARINSMDVIEEHGSYDEKLDVRISSHQAVLYIFQENQRLKGENQRLKAQVCCRFY